GRSAPSGAILAVTAPIALAAGVPGSVSAAVARLDGREVVLVKVDPTTRRGALDADAGATLALAAEAALEARLPLVGVVASSGADVNAGVDALHGWGTAARSFARCSGVVPILLAVTGPTLSGPALLLGMADVVVMTEAASAYVVGPGAVASFTGEHVEPQALGGPGVHAAQTGVAAAVVDDDDEALELLAAVLAHLPDHVDATAPRWPSTDPVDRPTPEAGAVLPATAAGSYDVLDVVRTIADDGEVLELWGDWAPNLVTALATVDGRSVGMVANQPLALAGSIDIPASQKGARFVGLCDSFNVPLVTLVDTSGFFPGKDREWRGMIRHGAQLVGAYARASVPRVCVVLRKAYGGAYIVMDSKTMGNDVCLAWPSAELAVMGARQAAGILHRRDGPEVRAAKEAEYATTLLNPWKAAERGYVDAVIDPADTRRAVATALEMLASKREHLPRRAHDNLPL
ncbi:MAG TPA: carboxyl transferase domain-containing protein, partial [Acidimicrobiales bacterium]|nr:carboxyl transferase domain-containing protein [Acidimicrobiales bacterium]